MTNEKILEELEKSYDGEISEDAFKFGLEYKPNREGSMAGYRNIARGFYAGFRAAERLAKIEVLEEIHRFAELNGEYKTADRIDGTINELKANL